MTVYFVNEGAMDLDVVRIMGVSVKDNENPIGYFGTGLKYAIATLLRTGHEVKMFLLGEEYVFTSREKTIRGKKFQAVYMNDEQLGFTTDLGKNWEVWQAYRELHSNCLDEKGRITNRPAYGDTAIEVTGPEIEEVYHERGKIFLQGDPAWFCEGLEVYRGSSQYVYYRGVRVHHLKEKSRFTYNIVAPMRLTEDRTVDSEWDLHYRLETLIPKIADHEFARKIVDPNSKFMEADLGFAMCHNPSEEFLDEIQKVAANAKTNESLIAMLRQLRKGADEIPRAELSKAEKQTVEEALEFIAPLNTQARPEDFFFTETLGGGVYGQYKDGQIYIARQTIANGAQFLGITMYEEWIHKQHGYPDKSRGMQQFLFDKINFLLRELSDK